MKRTTKDFFSLKEVFTTRNMVVMAMMLALKVVISPFSIYLSPTFQLITFGYLPGAMVSILYGPVAGLVFGFAADTVGYIMNPMGGYFIGYALSEMMGNFVYALFLYKKPLTIPRVLAARLVIMATVTFGLNFLWNVIMYGAAASKYFTGARLINNLVQLPLYVALILFFGRLVLRIEKNYTGGMKKPV